MILYILGVILSIVFGLVALIQDKNLEPDPATSDLEERVIMVITMSILSWITVFYYLSVAIVVYFKKRKG